MGGSLVGYSMPIFWWGLILILVFSVKLGLTPVSGRIDLTFDIPLYSGLYLIDTLQAAVVKTDGLKPFWSALSHLVLPATALGTIPLAVIARMTRSSMLEVLGEDYIRTARAKGLGENTVNYKHALRNALIPIATGIGGFLGVFLSGSLIIEAVFRLNGIGLLSYNSLLARDYNVIMGLIFLSSVVLMVGRLVSDIVYVFIDPRIDFK
jgi:dipeptide transport system permease protein